MSDTAVIKTRSGVEILVDLDDYAALSQFKWYIATAPRNRYAFRYSGLVNGLRTCIKMHREVLGLSRGDTRMVDHINSNTLDNRRENLRFSSPSENQLNRGPMKGRTFKGVWFYKRSGKWGASLRHEGEQFHLGYFSTPEEAALAYNAKAVEIGSEFRRLNVVR